MRRRALLKAAAAWPVPTAFSAGLATSLTTGLVTGLLASTNAQAQGVRSPVMPPTPSGLDWSAHAAIYEVNIRQHSLEGTLRAVEADLPRIRAMGVGILWLMPLQPIGELRRKGILGSYYSIRDYTAVNPEFGTLDDLKRLVKTAQGLGLKVILDWVPNHTAWDHPWITQHPDWYRKGSDGQISAVKANPDNPADTEFWEDVAQLDYSKPEMAVAMIEAMRFWRTEARIDGFRCDVAGFLPNRFWEIARQVLQQDGPLIMLAESDKPELHKAGFDITYDWKLQQTLQRIAQGQADAQSLLDWWKHRVQRYPSGSIGMNFLTNHDINTWHGSDQELYGSTAALQAMAVLMATLPGIPLLYSGQETFFRKRLAFFEKDPIDWQERPLEGFYTQMIKQRLTQPGLHAPLMLDGLEWLPDENKRVITFQRAGTHGPRIQVSVNLSGEPQTAIGRVKLPAWGWQIGGVAAPLVARPGSATRKAPASKPAAKKPPPKKASPAKATPAKATPAKAAPAQNPTSRAAPAGNR